MPRPRGKSTVACQTDTVFLTGEQVETIVKKALNHLSKEVEKLKSDIESLTSTNEQLTNDYDALNHLQQATEVDLNQLQETCNEATSKLQKKVDDLERTNLYFGKTLCDKDSVITKLTSTIDQLEQDKKMNNIRIVGVPEEDEGKEEDVRAKVLDTTKKLNLPKQIKGGDLQSVTRMGRHRQNKPRDILVTFRCREIRDIVYQNRKNMPRNVNQPIFINEDLTLHRGKLFYQARLKKKAGKLQATWTQSGTVMVKTDADANPCAVSTYPELKELLSKDTTSSCSEITDIDDEWILRESSSTEY